MKVLIVDDHELVRRGIRTLFADEENWTVCGEAATGGEAIELTRTLRPDIVLLDVTLPDMEAAEAVSQILVERPGTRIVALALPSAGKLAARALAAGAASLGMKSDSAKDLFKTLERMAFNEVVLSHGAVKLLQMQLVKEAASDANPKDLTPRELGILKLLAVGQTNKQVSALLNISVKTVDTHRANIMRKLKLVTYSDLVQFAIRHSLIEV